MEPLEELQPIFPCRSRLANAGVTWYCSWQCLKPLIIPRGWSLWLQDSPSSLLTKTSLQTLADEGKGWQKCCWIPPCTQGLMPMVSPSSHIGVPLPTPVVPLLTVMVLYHPVPTLTKFSSDPKELLPSLPRILSPLKLPPMAHPQHCLEDILGPVIP